MKVFDREPTDWSDLQDLVGQLFSELGCEVQVNKKMALVRGYKAVDVWVRDQATSPPSTILVECKFWASAIPQEVIHSFRTVVLDAGANRGFVVSRVGFQAGAHEAVRLTNVDLVTFDRLQELFFDRWNVSMARRLRPYADRLFVYWDPSGGRVPRIPWTDQHREHHRRLVEAYRPLISLGPSMEMTGFRWQLPMTLPSVRPPADGQADRIVLRTHRQVYDFIERHKDAALAEFQILHGETPL